MPASPSAREVVERFLEVQSALDTDEVLKIYADDVVVEFPFALVGPKRIEGTETIRQMLGAYDEGPMAQTVHYYNVVVYETTDPELVIVEFDAEGTIAHTGRTFQLPNIQVMRVRDGRIVFSKNYHNDLGRAHAAGMADQVVAALTANGEGGRV